MIPLNLPAKTVEHFEGNRKNALSPEVRKDIQIIVYKK
jgi:hypothetical protein